MPKVSTLYIFAVLWQLFIIDVKTMCIVFHTVEISRPPSRGEAGRRDASDDQDRRGAESLNYGRDRPASVGNIKHLFAMFSSTRQESRKAPKRLPNIPSGPSPRKRRTTSRLSVEIGRAKLTSTRRISRRTPVRAVASIRSRPSSAGCLRASSKGPVPPKMPIRCQRVGFLKIISEL